LLLLWLYSFDWTLLFSWTLLLRRWKCSQPLASLGYGPPWHVLHFTNDWLVITPRHRGGLRLRPFMSSNDCNGSTFTSLHPSLKIFIIWFCCWLVDSDQKGHGSQAGRSLRGNLRDSRPSYGFTGVSAKKHCWRESPSVYCTFCR
jgi:hypothetical protein